MATRKDKETVDPDGRLLDIYTTVQFRDGEDGTHCCKRGSDLLILLFDSAAEYCESDQDGRLWVRTYDEEYGNEVLFCPFCGIPSTAVKG